MNALMDMTDLQQNFNVSRDSDVAIIIRQVRQFAEDFSFSDIEQSMITTAVSELAHNILKYATRGSIFAQVVVENGKIGMEIIANDFGPGIEDTTLALRDHHSTGGTLGLGLPGVKRLMDDFSLVSEKDKGTRVIARKWKKE